MFSLKLLAALLAVYAMGGVLLAAMMVTARDPRLRWQMLAASGILFAAAAGSSALSLWRVERRAVIWLVACGVLGAALCLLLPLASIDVPATPAMWRSAALGAALFLAFLLMAAFYVRRVVHARDR
ncbi:MAG TPA: hypothetical protein VFW98_02090 [Gemmatimonadaceae bacterium]|nr:hypothetical protein [Gemmatimonadaceae bacterium]